MTAPSRSRLGALSAPYRRLRRPGGASAQAGDAGALEEASRRIEDIAAAADRAVEEIRRQVQADADRMEHAKVIDRKRIAAELTQTLLARTEALRAEAEALARIVDRASIQLRAIDSIAGDLEPIGPGPGGSSSRATAFDARSEGSAGVRQLVSRMAAAGRSRDEIADHVRTEFGVGDVESVLDGVLGAAS